MTTPRDDPNYQAYMEIKMIVDALHKHDNLMVEDKVRSLKKGELDGLRQSLAGLARDHQFSDPAKYYQFYAKFDASINYESLRTKLVEQARVIINGASDALFAKDKSAGLKVVSRNNTSGPDIEKIFLTLLASVRELKNVYEAKQNKPSSLQNSAGIYKRLSGGSLAASKASAKKSKAMFDIPTSRESAAMRPNEDAPTTFSFKVPVINAPEADPNEKQTNHKLSPSGSPRKG